MIVTTTSTVEGHPAEKYLGIVSGEHVLSEGAFSGKSGWADSMLEARQKAQTVMMQRAIAKGANAIIGVSVDFELHGSIQYVMITGTAVTVS